MEAPIYKTLDIYQVELDIENPRIKQYLENYKKVTAEGIAMALSNPGNGDSTNSYTSLKESIKVSQGIIHPIIVNYSNGKYVVIEGNTRLQIYHENYEANPEGPWRTIPALVYNDLSSIEKHKIRLQSHLVGPREWDPYSKAKYLFQLSEIECLPMNTIIAMCGGNSSDINKQIAAYKQMEKYYRPIVEEIGDTFNPQEFSKFREMQSATIRNAMQSKGHDEKDFAEWVAKGNVDKAQKVRSIPEIFKDKDAYDTFLKSNISEAEKKIVINKSKDIKNLDNVPIDLLVLKLNEKLELLPYKEINSIANEEKEATRKMHLFDLYDTITETIKEIKAHENG